MSTRLLPAFLLIALVGCQTTSAAPESGPASPAASETESASSDSDAATSAAKDASADDHDGRTFDQWLADFRRQARSEGISEDTLARALDGVRYRPRVIELDGSQPEFVRPVWQYLDTAVSNAPGDPRA